jgi:hypothetical protein
MMPLLNRNAVPADNTSVLVRGVPTAKVIFVRRAMWGSKTRPCLVSWYFDFNLDRRI